MISHKMIICHSFLCMSMAINAMDWSAQNTEKQMDLDKNTSDFIWFSSKNNLPRVKKLVALGVTIDAKNKKGSSALHWASFKGYVDIVSFLLDNGAQVDIRDKNYKTPLQWAAGAGHADIVVALLKHNADVNLVDEKGDTALHWATFNFHNRIVKKLLDHKAKINIQNNEGISPLNTALIVGNAPVVQLLVEKKAALLTDKHKRNPVHCAAWGSNSDCLQLITAALREDKKMDFINGRDSTGETPLHYAVITTNPEIVSALVKSGANVNIKDYAKKRTPIHVCLRNHEGSKIKAKSISEYMRKRQHRLSTRQVVAFVTALKQAPDLDMNTVDIYGLSTRDSANLIHYKNDAEKKKILDLLS